jgi:TonB family protein
MNKQDSIRNLEIAIFISALLHIMILYAVRIGGQHINSSTAHLKNDYIQLTTIPPERINQSPENPHPAEKSQSVEKANKEKLVIKNQIVDIPKPLIQEVPKKTAYLSNWNQSVKEEMVSRHKGGGYGTDHQSSLEVNVHPKLPPASTSASEQQNSQLQKPQQTMNKEGIALSSQESPQTNNKVNNAQTVNNNELSGKDERLALNSMLPSYSRMRSIPGIGDNNYLPGLKEGDVTLLNTKSFVYAGFVRRVAYRIFDRFIFDVRNSNITQEDISNVEGHAYVEADMNQQGKLVSVRLLKSSGSPEWDHIAIEACKSATWDANPPKGAEGKDGLIHFVFAPGRDVLVVGLLE